MDEALTLITWKVLHTYLSYMCKSVLRLVKSARKYIISIKQNHIFDA
jgi:hypothetical protein